MLLRRKIRAWRVDAEKFYGYGLGDGLRGDKERSLSPVWYGFAGREGYRTGYKAALAAKDGNWPIDVELPDKVWARILAHKLRHV